MIEDKLTSIKCISVSDLDDRVLLDEKKDLKSLESALSSLSDKITSLCERIPLYYKNRAGTIGEHSHRERELTLIDVLDSYKHNLSAELAFRNISKEILSSTQSLEIKLSKFSGYYSTSDIYTFQSEFERLYLPSLQKKLVPDFLMNNYLEGHALVLVKNIEDLQKIWTS